MAALDIVSLLDRNTPDFTESEVSSIARQYFGVEGDFKRLPSERDQSYCLTAADKQYILKISNAQDTPQDIDFQTQALIHLAEQNPELPVPRIINTTENKSCALVSGRAGDVHVVRLLSFLPGDMIGDHANLNTPLLRKQVGRTVAQMTVALQGFFHPSARNVHPWDMMAFMVYRGHTHHIANETIRHLVESIFDHANTLLPKLKSLRHQVIHQDAHSGNLLIDPAQPDRISGIIDFGDMLYGPLMMDLVVACDLMMHRADDPVSHMCDIVAGFDSEQELTEQEVDLLYDMILVRNAITIAICAWRSAMRPEEGAYIDEIELYERLLVRLNHIGRAEVTGRFRKACRFPVYSPAIGEYQLVDDEQEETLKHKRKTLLGDPWHFYQQPLHFERALGPWLYGADGKA